MCNFGFQQEALNRAFLNIFEELLVMKNFFHAKTLFVDPKVPRPCPCPSPRPPPRYPPGSLWTRFTAGCLNSLEEFMTISVVLAVIADP